ncbi:MAG: carboxypeptidase-like regulatory domain-containing protein [Bacteroidia bacterium]|jgi:hypothetical protein|nr:carboxypeptidase-like regulatory domain-containing protein [Bacteroidia bacterium]
MILQLKLQPFFYLLLICFYGLYCTKPASAQSAEDCEAYFQKYHSVTKQNGYSLNYWIFLVQAKDTSLTNAITKVCVSKMNLQKVDSFVKGVSMEQTVLFTIQKQFSQESLQRFIQKCNSLVKEYNASLVDFGIYPANHLLPILANQMKSPFYGVSKQEINGQIVDRYGSGIPYASVGFAGSLFTCLTNDYGRFSLTVPINLLTDSLSIKATGFKEQKLLLEKELTQKVVIPMQDQTFDEEWYSVFDSVIKGKTSWVANKRGNLGLLPPAKLDGPQIARVFTLTDTVVLKKASVYIYGNVKLGTKLRLHIYTFNEQLQLPEREITTESVIEEKEVNDAWLDFDLTAYDINVSNSIAVAFEWLDASYNTTYIGATQKTGALNSYIQKQTLGLWQPLEDIEWSIRLQIEPTIHIPRQNLSKK